MNSGLDTYYVLRSEDNILKRELLGYKHTKIQPSDSSGKTWQIVDASNGAVLASTNLTFNEPKLFPTGNPYFEHGKFFPLGKRRWIFHQTECKSNPSVPWREMNLHLAVDQPGHFCCGDGTCISSELRCDNNHDCVDASDEEDCRMLQLPSYVYNPNLPPQVMIAKRHQRTFPKTVLNTSVDIWKLIDVTESTSEMSIIFALTMSWRDPHLTYNYLGSNDSGNHIMMSDTSRIWKPKIKLKFLRDKDSILTEQELKLKREGKAELSCGMDCLSPNETYKGSENSLVLTTHHQAVFTCSFPNADKYPFDKEECSFVFYLTGKDNKLTTLIPKINNIKSSSSVALYQVQRWRINETILPMGKKGVKVMLDIIFIPSLQSDNIQVTVELGRNIMSSMMVEFLPTLLMNLINQVPESISKIGETNQTWISH